MGHDVEGGPPVSQSGPRSFVEQSLIPFAVNTAGSVERALNQAATSARKAPFACFAAALGIGTLMAIAFGRHRD